MLEIDTSRHTQIDQMSTVQCKMFTSCKFHESVCFIMLPKGWSI